MKSQRHIPIPIVTLGVAVALLNAGCAARYTEPSLPDSHPASAKAGASPMPERSGTLDLTKADPVAAMPATMPMPAAMGDMTAPSGHGAHMHAAAGGDATEGALYTCPMHPEIVSKEPGRCPKCNMKLVTKKMEGGHE